MSTVWLERTRTVSFPDQVRVGLAVAAEHGTSRRWRWPRRSRVTVTEGSSRGEEVISGSDRVLNEGVGQALGEGDHGVPAGAVGGHDNVGLEVGQPVDCRRDDRVEGRTAEM